MFIQKQTKRDPRGASYPRGGKFAVNELQKCLFLLAFSAKITRRSSPRYCRASLRPTIYLTRSNVYMAERDDIPPAGRPPNILPARASGHGALRLRFLEFPQQFGALFAGGCDVTRLDV